LYLWLILAFIFASFEAIAVSKDVRKLEYVAKPAVMVCLFLWLYVITGLRGEAVWFGAGILFSLVGDVLLMISPDRMFLFGLIAFLFTHILYIIGFKEILQLFFGLQQLPVWWNILLLFILIAILGLIMRVTDSMRKNRQHALVNPVRVYGLVILLMSYSALSTLYDPAWKTDAASLVSIGAILFCASDTILAWNKFVTPIKHGRLLNITMYHLGQIGLIAGVILNLNK
jgi:uncharacterized membrane protein YhhN